MKIVFCTNKTVWDDEAKRYSFCVDGIKAVGKLAEVVFCGIGWENDLYKESKDADFIIIQAKKKTQTLCNDVNYVKDEKLFKNITAKKIILFDEMYNIDWVMQKILNTGAQYIIRNYSNDIKRYEGKKSIKGIKWANIPHCASVDLFKDYEEEKVNDVLFVGSVSRHYPFRERLRKLIEEKLSKLCKCKVIYKQERNKYCFLEGYAREINKSKITITTSSRYKYRLAKYVEVPLCGSLLAADLPAEDEGFIKRFALVLNTDDSDDQIIRKLMYYVEHDEQRMKKIKLGMKMNQEHFSQEVYAQQFVKVLEGWK